MAVDCGIDMFDCVYPTRCGRNGRAMTRDGEFNIFNATFLNDFTPIDARCGCYTCSTFSRAYLAHLFRSKEMLGPRLLSLHNVFLLDELMSQTREAIASGAWDRFKSGYLKQTGAV